MSDLLRDFGSSMAVPEPSDDAGIVLTSEQFPDIPSVLHAPDLHASVMNHFYEYGFSLPTVHLSAPKEVYRGLGLLLFAHALGDAADATRVVLSRSERGHLGEHRITELRASVRGIRRREELIAGATLLRAVAFEYWPALCKKHPWWPLANEDPLSLPSVNLGHENGLEVRPGSDAIVFGFGSLQGTIRMAELLLNISCGESKQDEYVLEGEPGFRGVAPASAELALNLPGSFFFALPTASE